jgi:thiosulfate dehydrogenase [quinone] large subunit
MKPYPFSDQALRSAELLLRASLILVMLLGGLGKMFAWEKFVATASAGFIESPLPMGFVKGFLYCVPVIEFVLGALILSGYQRERVLLAVGGLLLVFQFGHMMMQDFPGLSRVIVDLLLLAACMCLPAYRWSTRRERVDSPRDTASYAMSGQEI